MTRRPPSAEANANRAVHARAGAASTSTPNASTSAAQPGARTPSSRASSVRPTVVYDPPPRPPRYPRKPLAIGPLVEEFLRTHPQQDRLHRGKVLAGWAQVVGPHLAARSRNLRFERDRLVVEMPDAAWRYELHMNRARVIAKLNELAGRPVVRELIVRE